MGQQLFPVELLRTKTKILRDIVLGQTNKTHVVFFCDISTADRFYSLNTYHGRRVYLYLPYVSFSSFLFVESRITFYKSHFPFSSLGSRLVHSSKTYEWYGPKSALFDNKRFTTVIDWTEWSAIWSEIIRVILKSNERAAQIRLKVTRMF